MKRNTLHRNGLIFVFSFVITITIVNHINGFYKNQVVSNVGGCLLTEINCSHNENLQGEGYCSCYKQTENALADTRSKNKTAQTTKNQNALRIKLDYQTMNNEFNNLQHNFDVCLLLVNTT